MLQAVNFAGAGQAAIMWHKDRRGYTCCKEGTGNYFQYIFEGRLARNDGYVMAATLLKLPCIGRMIHSGKRCFKNWTRLQVRMQTDNSLYIWQAEEAMEQWFICYWTRMRMWMRWGTISQCSASCIGSWNDHSNAAERSGCECDRRMPRQCSASASIRGHYSNARIQSRGSMIYFKLSKWMRILFTNRQFRPDMVSDLYEKEFEMRSVITDS
jgi:hypothetical protein